MSRATDMLTFWAQALAQPLGIYLTTPDPVRLKDHLYNARAAAQRQGDRAYDHLQIRTSPRDPKGELWLVNPAPSLLEE